VRKALLSWSTGKDSAWALHVLSEQGGIDVVGLITTFNSAADRVAMHAVRRPLAEAQAARTGLPLWPVELPWPCSNREYEDLMSALIRRAVDEGIEVIAFGDLFLEDIRSYRERQLKGTGIDPLFPLWKLPTRQLAVDMISAGVKAKVTCVDPSKLDRSYAGRDFDLDFINSLPPKVDACGENGEFHTFVSDAPCFTHGIPVLAGEIVERDGFVFADLLGPPLRANDGPARIPVP
jgi:uncharacterized protein (TIGR00290 family)